MAWRAVKARHLLRALERLGWNIKRQRGSHKILNKAGRFPVVFAIHDGAEVGPKILARIAKETGLQPEDL